jgi:hypothetical protein
MIQEIKVRSANGEKMETYKLETVLTFGKHKGKTIRVVLENDPSYIVWMAEELDANFSQDVLIAAQKAAKEQHRNWLRDNYDDTGEDDDWGDRD